MPNWCEGTLKVRGEKENLTRFILEGLKPINLLGGEKEPLEFNRYGEIESKETCWIEGTQRGFVNNLYISSYDIEEDELICLDAKFAWSIDVKGLQKACQKFKVDMRMFGFELGMEFNKEVEIIDGEITMDDEITFNDYRWECPCPNMGG